MDLSELKEKEKIQNQGRGVSCIRTLISYLEKGDIESAKAVFVNEGDKIANYPELETILENILGLKGRYKTPPWSGENYPVPKTGGSPFGPIGPGD